MHLHRKGAQRYALRDRGRGPRSKDQGRRDLGGRILSAPSVGQVLAGGSLTTDSNMAAHVKRAVGAVHQLLRGTAQTNDKSQRARRHHVINALVPLEKTVPAILLLTFRINGITLN